MLAHARCDLPKREPLVLSRGVVAGSTNVFPTLSHAGLTGRGEAAPNGVTGDTTASIEAALESCRATVEGFVPRDVDAVGRAFAACPSPAARAGLEMAALDWLAQRRGVTLGGLLGLDPARRPAASITVGLGEPGAVAARAAAVRDRWAPTAIKLKLGSPAGVATDVAIVDAARAAVGPGTELWVDANGGWSPAAARQAVPRLVDAGVRVVEQPLPPARPGPLAELCELAGDARIYLDESVHRASDVAFAAGRCHGVNIKLMKCGGIGEALRVAEAARAAGLELMLGCMGESSLAITAAAHLAPLADRVDLDSNLNIDPDPFVGATWRDGRLVAPTGPGLGARAR